MWDYKKLRIYWSIIVELGLLADGGWVDKQESDHREDYMSH